MNTNLRGRRRLAPFFLFLLVVGCAKNPTTVPTPAPIQVASATNALAQALEASVQPLIAARENGKLSQPELAVAFSIMENMGQAVKKINAELQSADTWDVQKLRMVGIISAAGMPYLSAQLPPNARLILTMAIAGWNSIAVAVGGPTL